MGDTNNFDYDYIVIGSGFGGSVAALRLSEKGYRVLVIEKGKWFGQLRYLGYSITEEDVTIKWITQDGQSIISAIFSKNKLYIDAKIVSEDDQNNALNASHELMGYISKLISKTKHN